LLFVCLLFHPIQLTEMNNHLNRLSKYLNYEFSSIGLFGLSFFYPIFLILALLVIIPFTFYMIFVLAKEKRYGWIIFFFCFVILPLILILLFVPNPVFMLIMLAPFFLYCIMLKSTVNGWNRDRNFIMKPVN
jgi:hypothetical protein